jgi:hypothetical protein
VGGSDPTERTNVASSNPTVVASMQARLAELAKSFNQNTPLQGNNTVFCTNAAARGGALGPFLGPWIPDAPTE